jgi:predicted nucleotide-binding protein
MERPRIFLGSSVQHATLLEALTRGLDDVAHVEPWTTSFNPGTSTLERLLELTREVDFAAFVFAHGDWTANGPATDAAATPGQASPRDSVVFEAGLFGGVPASSTGTTRPGASSSSPSGSAAGMR